MKNVYSAMRVMLFVCMVFMLAQLPVWAAGLPKQEGVVTDPVGLFSAADAKRIADSVSGKGYELQVLTARGLNEKDGEKLANDAYDGWKLKPNQLILVITTDPNFVHLVFDNVELKDRVAASAARNAKGVVDRAFVPLAGSGKVADGVIAVSRYVNELPPAPAGAASSVKGMSGKTIAIVVLALAILVLLVVLIRQLGLRSKAKATIREAEKLRADADKTVSGVIVSQLLKELEMGFMQGETKQRVSGLEKEAIDLQRQGQELVERLGQQRMSFWSAAADGRAAKQLKGEVEAYVGRVGQAKATQEELESLSAAARHTVASVKTQAEEASVALESLASDTAYPLPVLREQLKQVRALGENADNVDEFDFVQADSLAQQALQLAAVLTAGVTELRRQVKLYPGYVPRLRDRESELRLAVERERLLLIDADPFRMLKQAEGELPRLGKLIESGDATGAKACSDLVEGGLQGASDAVAEMVSNRDYGHNAVREAERFLSGIGEFEASYATELAQLRGKFGETHVREQEGRLAQTKQANDELTRLLKELRGALDPGVQQYRLARQRGERANLVVAQAAKTREESLAYRARMEQALREANDRFAASRTRYLQAADAFARLQVSMDAPRRMVADGKTQLSGVESALRAGGVDMGRVEQQLQSFGTLVDGLTAEVGRLAREKEESMRLYNQLHSDYMSRYERYGKVINVAAYASSYAGMKGDIERLIATGRFEEATRRITDGRGIISQLEREYLRHQEEERRRNGGGGGGGGGGRSSGSSGWGGGGGSGGGKSSGSSKW
ncbi:hypothetical protein ACFFNY_13200 [Paenibacillus hodogayensis]|uniref:TPM domain-containing protein n=1 Tax=Paenibacillus hodogayensis TaxID=279208 RepID=A0ABV5VWA5_9BACL